MIRPMHVTCLGSTGLSCDNPVCRRPEIRVKCFSFALPGWLQFTGLSELVELFELLVKLFKYRVNALAW